MPVDAWMPRTIFLPQQLQCGVLMPLQFLMSVGEIGPDLASRLCDAEHLNTVVVERRVGR